VLAQTYTHWDYTIVNNCSTDRTFEIAREYAAREPRIRIYNNETFVPVIANYNIAFRNISPQSKYCKVVGADDWIYPECLEKMVGLAERHPNVAIVGSYQLFGTSLDPTYCRPALQPYGPGHEPVLGDLPFPSTVMSGHEACRKYLLEDVGLFGAPTALLFGANIVRSRYSFYNEPHLRADAEVCFEVLQHHDFGFVHQVLAFNRVRQNSLTSSTVRDGMMFLEKLGFVLNFGPKYLTEKELKACLPGKLALYYYYLGSQIYKRRGQDFWSKHRSHLAELGYSLNMPRVLLYAIFYALGAADQAARQAVKGLRKAGQGE
jgi:glycosyltransferase involved in cell wall biosynthesis